MSPALNAVIGSCRQRSMPSSAHAASAQRRHRLMPSTLDTVIIGYPPGQTFHHVELISL